VIVDVTNTLVRI